MSRSEAVAGSVEDARKRMAGFAKLGPGRRLVTIAQFQQRLYKSGKRERRAMHPRRVDAQRFGQPFDPRSDAHIVESRRVDLVGADHPAPQHRRVDVVCCSGGHFMS